MAQQYESHKLYQEAITEYKRIIDNKNFADAARLKVNIGNIYMKMGNLTEAMRMYQMAFDQTSKAQKITRYRSLIKKKWIFSFFARRLFYELRIEIAKFTTISEEK